MPQLKHSEKKKKEHVSYWGNFHVKMHSSKMCHLMNLAVVPTCVATAPDRVVCSDTPFLSWHSVPLSLPWDFRWTKTDTAHSFVSGSLEKEEQTWKAAWLWGLLCGCSLRQCDISMKQINKMHVSPAAAPRADCSISTEMTEQLNEEKSVFKISGRVTEYACGVKCTLNFTSFHKHYLKNWWRT